MHVIYGRPQNENANENAYNSTYSDWNSWIGSPGTFTRILSIIRGDDNAIGKTEELVNTISINIVIGIHPAWLSRIKLLIYFDSVSPRGL